MQDTAIKNFCIWARRELLSQVALQARRFGIREDGYDPATADAIEGRPLTAEERRQRADLIRRLGPADAPATKTPTRTSSTRPPTPGSTALSPSASWS